MTTPIQSIQTNQRLPQQQPPLPGTGFTFATPSTIPLGSFQSSSSLLRTKVTRRGTTPNLSTTDKHSLGTCKTNQRAWDAQGINTPATTATTTSNREIEIHSSAKSRRLGTLGDETTISLAKGDFAEDCQSGLGSEPNSSTRTPCTAASAPSEEDQLSHSHSHSHLLSDLLLAIERENFHDYEAKNCKLVFTHFIVERREAEITQFMQTTFKCLQRAQAKMMALNKSIQHRANQKLRLKQDSQDANSEHSALAIEIDEGFATPTQAHARLETRASTERPSDELEAFESSRREAISYQEFGYGACREFIKSSCGQGAIRSPHDCEICDLISSNCNLLSSSDLVKLLHCITKSLLSPTNKGVAIRLMRPILSTLCRQSGSCDLTILNGPVRVAQPLAIVKCVVAYLCSPRREWPGHLIVKLFSCITEMPISPCAAATAQEKLDCSAGRVPCAEWPKLASILIAKSRLFGHEPVIRSIITRFTQLAKQAEDARIATRESNINSKLYSCAAAYSLTQAQNSIAPNESNSGQNGDSTNGHLTMREVLTSSGEVLAVLASELHHEHSIGLALCKLSASRQIVLSPFSLACLLTVCRLARFNASVLSQLQNLILDDFTERQRRIQVSDQSVAPSRDRALRASDLTSASGASTSSCSRSISDSASAAPLHLHADSGDMWHHFLSCAKASHSCWYTIVEPLAALAMQLCDTKCRSAKQQTHAKSSHCAAAAAGHNSVASPLFDCVNQAYVLRHAFASYNPQCTAVVNCVRLGSAMLRCLYDYHSHLRIEILTSLLARIRSMCADEESKSSAAKTQAEMSRGATAIFLLSFFLVDRTQAIENKKALQSKANACSINLARESPTLTSVPLVQVEAILKSECDLVLSLPGSLAFFFLSSLMPLFASSLVLRQSLMILFQKSQCSHSLQVKRCGAFGFCSLIGHTHRQKTESQAKESSGSLASRTSASASASMSAFPSASLSSDFACEFGPFLQRSMQAEFAVRTQVYNGLARVASSCAALTKPILKLLTQQFERYIVDGITHFACENANRANLISQSHSHSHNRSKSRLTSHSQSDLLSLDFDLCLSVSQSDVVEPIHTLMSSIQAVLASLLQQTKVSPHLTATKSNSNLASSSHSGSLSSDASIPPNSLQSEVDSVQVIFSQVASYYAATPLSELGFGDQELREFDETGNQRLRCHLQLLAAVVSNFMEFTLAHRGEETLSATVWKRFKRLFALHEKVNCILRAPKSNCRNKVKDEAEAEPEDRSQAKAKAKPKSIAKSSKQSSTKVSDKTQGKGKCKSVKPVSRTSISKLRSANSNSAIDSCSAQSGANDRLSLSSPISADSVLLLLRVSQQHSQTNQSSHVENEDDQHEETSQQTESRHLALYADSQVSDSLSNDDSMLRFVFSNCESIAESLLASEFEPHSSAAAVIDDSMRTLFAIECVKLLLQTSKRLVKGLCQGHTAASHRKSAKAKSDSNESGPGARAAGATIRKSLYCACLSALLSCCRFLSLFGAAKFAHALLDVIPPRDLEQLHQRSKSRHAPLFWLLSRLHVQCRTILELRRANEQEEAKSQHQFANEVKSILDLQLFIAQILNQFAPDSDRLSGQRLYAKHCTVLLSGHSIASAKVVRSLLVYTHCIMPSEDVSELVEKVAADVATLHNTIKSALIAPHSASGKTRFLAVNEATVHQVAVQTVEFLNAAFEEIEVKIERIKAIKRKQETHILSKSRSRIRSRVNQSHQQESLVGHASSASSDHADDEMADDKSAKEESSELTAAGQKQQRQEANRNQERESEKSFLKACVEEIQVLLDACTSSLSSLVACLRHLVSSALEPSLCVPVLLALARLYRDATALIKLVCQFKCDPLQSMIRLISCINSKLTPLLHEFLIHSQSKSKFGKQGKPSEKGRTKSAKAKPTKRQKLISGRASVNPNDSMHSTSASSGGAPRLARIVPSVQYHCEQFDHWVISLAKMCAAHHYSCAARIEAQVSVQKRTDIRMIEDRLCENQASANSCSKLYQHQSSDDEQEAQDANAESADSPHSRVQACTPSPAQIDSIPSPGLCPSEASPHARKQIDAQQQQQQQQPQPQSMQGLTESCEAPHQPEVSAPQTRLVPAAAATAAAAGPRVKLEPRQDQQQHN